MRRSIPLHVEAAVLRALEKLPADRFENARAFADALRDERFTHVTSRASSRSPVVARQIVASRLALIGGALLALLGLAAAAWAWRLDGAGTSSPPVQLMLDVGGANPELARFAVSPDGGTFAFATAEGIAVRDAGQRDYRILPGTQSGEAPSFSPDGLWLVFHFGGRLRKVAVKGGSAIALITGDSVRAGRANWGEDGSIVFESGQRLYLIPAQGDVLRLLAGAQGAQSPRLLPDGSGVLYVDTRSGSKLMLYDLATDTATTVLEESSEGQYVGTGHIVYAHPAGGLFAIRFDPGRRTVTGAPIPLVSDLQANGSVAPFVVTRSGTLVYRAGLEAESRLLLRDVGGRLDTLPLAPRILSYARFSPDGRALALTVGSARGTNRYTAIYDLALGALTQFTFEGGGHSPVWSPDGQRIAFTAEGDDSDAEDLFVQPVDRSAKPKRIVRIPGDQHANAWPADSLLVFSDAAAPRTGGTNSAGGGGDLFLVNPSRAAATPRAYLAAQWAESEAAISPDGRFAAYTSTESGALEVYVRPFPAPGAGGQYKISAGGGYRARWSPDGRTILYQGLDGRTIHAAHVTPGSRFAVVSREVVLTIPGLGLAWDMDGRTGRIVVSQAVGSASARIIVIVNWLERLRRASDSAPSR